MKLESHVRIGRRVPDPAFTGVIVLSGAKVEPAVGSLTIAEVVSVYVLPGIPLVSVVRIGLPADDLAPNHRWRIDGGVVDRVGVGYVEGPPPSDLVVDGVAKRSRPYDPQLIVVRVLHPVDEG